MDAPTLYHVDRFGAFTGVTSIARHSPADEGVVWLIPEAATLDAPPPPRAGEVAVLRDGRWSVLPDYRGQSVYDKRTGASRVIEEPGDIGDGETPNPPPSLRHVWTDDRWALPLADARAARIAEVGAELVRRNAEGFTHAGKRYQLDELSQQRITSLAVLAQARSLPKRFAFIAADNEAVPFQPTGFVDFAAAAGGVVVARQLNARALKDQILTAPDAEAVAAIDVTEGWD